MRAKFKTVFLLVAMTASLTIAGTALAQIVVGGGSTLPESFYRELLPSGVGLTSYSYTGAGSGAGKKAFLLNDARATVESEFRNESSPSRPIWPATQSVHFAASESVLTADERNAYTVAHVESSPGVPVARAAAWGPLIQIPVLGTAVLIPYKSSITSGVTNLDLPEAKMCAVFSKQPGGRTWGELLGTGTADTTPIQVIYNDEPSGTTELLSRYLVAACPGSGFRVSSDFRTMVEGSISPGIPQPRLSTAPPNPQADAIWLAVKGDGGMSGSFGSAGRIGYISPDPAYNPSNNIRIAKINGFLPDAASIKLALGLQALRADDAKTDPLAWVPTYMKPPVSGIGASYPIFGTTNLLLNQCYRDVEMHAQLKHLLFNLFKKETRKLIAAHGFAELPDGTLGTSNWRSRILTTFFSSSSAQSIGYPNVCNGIGRPVAN